MVKLLFFKHRVVRNRPTEEDHVDGCYSDRVDWFMMFTLDSRLFGASDGDRTRNRSGLSSESSAFELPTQVDVSCDMQCCLHDIDHNDTCDTCKLHAFRG